MASGETATRYQPARENKEAAHFNPHRGNGTMNLFKETDLALHSMIISTLFKIMVCILFSIFLVLYYINSQNGRYQYHDDPPWVFDRQSGAIYSSSALQDGKWFMINPVNGDARLLTFRSAKKPPTK